MKRSLRVFLLLWIILICLSVVVKVESIEENTQRNYNYLLVGNGEYEYLTRLRGPEYDLERLEEVFGRARYRDEKDKTITVKQDLRKEEILEAIRETFENSGEEDINFFYYGGHGVVKENVGYITGVEARGEEGYLNARELRRELDQIKGTKIIILDSCYSGSFIGESRSDQNQLEKFNKSFLDEFRSANKRSFYGDEYKILTAAGADEPSWDVKGNEYYEYGGEFTIALIDGLGYRGEVLADSENINEVSLDELYKYSYENTPRSSVQVYPKKDQFIIYQYDSEIEVEDLEVEDKMIVELESNKRDEIIYKIYMEDQLIREEKVGLLPGKNRISWDGKDQEGNDQGDGKYRIVLETKEARMLGELDFYKTSKVEKADIRIEKDSTKLIIDLSIKEAGEVIVRFTEEENKVEEINLGRQEKNREVYEIDLRDIGILKTPKLKVSIKIE